MLIYEMFERSHLSTVRAHEINIGIAFSTARWSFQ